MIPKLIEGVEIGPGKKRVHLSEIKKRDILRKKRFGLIIRIRTIKEVSVEKKE